MTFSRHGLETNIKGSWFVSFTLNYKVLKLYGLRNSFQNLHTKGVNFMQSFKENRTFSRFWKITIIGTIMNLFKNTLYTGPKNTNMKQMFQMQDFFFQ